MRALPIATLALTLVAATGCTTGAGHDARAADVRGGSGVGEVDPELTRLLASRTAGAPRSCLSLTERRESQTFRGSIVFGRGTTVYRNDLNGCPELNSNAIPIFRTPTGQLCSGEIVQLVDRSSQFPIGACSIGPFVPYARAAR